MECSECGGGDAIRTNVVYTDGTTERLILCTDCETEFRRGEFVTDVIHQE